MEIKILVDYNKKEDLQNFIKVCEQHGFNVTREGGGNIPNWSGWYAELKCERWQKKTEQQCNCNLPDVIHSGNWKCLLCGRDTFTHKTPHKCKGGYRKRNIIWEKIS